MDCDDQSRIADLSSLGNVPIVGRERDPSGCRASGLLPVHVVLVPPLLVPPPWPAVVVTSKLWTTAM